MLHRARTLDDVSYDGKRVLLRLDLNVPVAGGVVTGKERLVRSLTSIEELSEGRARTVILSHLGRPGGRYEQSLSLEPVAAALSAMRGRPVTFVPETIGTLVSSNVDATQPGDVIMLENLRFHSGEETDDPDFARAISDYGDLYVNDAFSVSHRAHASVSALPRMLPAAMGRLMQQEVQTLTNLFESPTRPLAAIVGGAKVSSKLALLEHLLERCDVLIIVGAMANTFLAATGVDVGKSLHEPEMAGVALHILERARVVECRIVLPVDGRINGDNGEPGVVSDLNTMNSCARLLDIGPASESRIIKQLQDCATLIWNGPCGAFEQAGFETGTVRVAQHAAERTVSSSLVTIAGGGDTAAALEMAGVRDSFSYLSTAGGAFLAWLEGTPLPGVETLKSSPP